MVSQEKQAIISLHERKFFAALTESVLEKPVLSVWMILIPFLIIDFMQRQKKYRQWRDTFQQGLLFTKLQALEAATALVAGLPAATFEAELVGKVRRNPLAEAPLQRLYQAQLNEICLLTKHYCRLLSTNAFDYAAMARAAYRPEEFEVFLIELAHREQIVNEAAIDLNSEPDLIGREMIKRLEKETFLKRKSEAEQIFACNRA